MKEEISNIKFSFDLNILNNETIEITEIDLIGNIYRQYLETKNKAVRDALIKLGWTPPKEIGNGKNRHATI